MAQPAEEHFDIAIVGYGPVGATLANLLGLCGLQVLVIERETAFYHLPRAVHFDAEVMRVFQSIGLADKIEDVTMYHPGMRFLNAEGDILLDWPRPLEAGPQGWKGGYRFHQPDLESILRQGLARFPNVTVRTRCEVFLVEDRGDRVHLRYESMAKGEIHRVTAKYVVGCDGARSLIRRFIESGMEDYGFHERWLVIDVILKTPKPELGDFSIQYCNPARPSTYVPVPGNRRRWEITVLPDEDSNEIVKPDAVWALLRDWITPQEAVLERAAVYTFHSLIAERWRSGRLFLAGDSCHQTPPFMGQGMCAGMRDVSNLAWKLALAARGEAGDPLLDTYQSERHPNARRYITTAVRLGGLINTLGAEEALRAATPGEEGTAIMKSLTSSLGQGIGFGPHAGELFPQPRLIDNQLMDDRTGYAPVLVIDAAHASGLRYPGHLVVITTAEAPTAAADLAALDACAVLLRPDRYILGIAETPSGIPALLAAAPASPLGCAQPAQPHIQPETV